MSRGLDKDALLAVFFLGILAATFVQPGFGSVTWTKMPGSTLDGPGMVFVYQSDPISWSWLDFVVRGTGDKIYYTRYSLTDGSKQPWQWVGGLTPSAPAISYASGNDFVAVRGMDDGIYWKWVFDSSWHRLSGSTISGPAINATSDNMLYVMVRGKDNRIYWCTVSTLSPSYTQASWHGLSGATKDRPSFFITGLDMYVAVRGMDDGIYWCKVNLSTFAQSTWHRIAGSTPSSPAITYWDLDPTYFTIAVGGYDGRIYYQHVRISDNHQTGWQTLPGGTPSGPAMWGGWGQGVILFFCVRGNDNGIYWTVI